MTTLHLPRRFALLPLATVMGLALAACGTQPASDAPGTEPPSDEPGTVEVRLVDYGFEGLPDEVPAGTRLTVVNEADEELHELVAFHLPDSEERSVQELAQLPPAELSAALGPPETVLLAPPDGEVVPAVGDGTLTEPGRYAIMCFIPTGADPDEYITAAAESEDGPPDVAGGPPHFVHGMLAELTVTE